MHNFEDLVVYIPSQYDCDWELLVREIGPKLPEKFQDILMTAKDRILEEGKLEVKLEIAKNLKEKIPDMDEDTLRETTGLSHEQLVKAGVILG